MVGPPHLLFEGDKLFDGRSFQASQDTILSLGVDTSHAVVSSVKGWLREIQGYGATAIRVLNFN
ncbi:MAG: hypothetical protein ACI89J_001792 [Hyphomicrobiaceae bacterium]|jgi:hypothetical protein